METLKKVKTHFNREFRDFDSFYNEKKGIFLKIIDGLFRRSMQMRFEKVIADTAPYENKTVLDVGCGTGRFSIALALKGIKKALGIDFAENMIDEADHLAQQFNVSHICQFVKADFMQMDVEEPFDHVFAMGVMDYIEDAVPFVKKIVETANKSVMISFPVPGGIIQRLRKFKFEKIQECPVFFYSKNDVERIAQQAGAQHFTIDQLAKDYFLTIFLTAKAREGTRREEVSHEGTRRNTKRRK